MEVGAWPESSSVILNLERMLALLYTTTPPLLVKGGKFADLALSVQL